MGKSYKELREEIAAKQKRQHQVFEAAGPDFDLDKAVGIVPDAKSSDDVLAFIQRNERELAALDKEFAPLRDLEASRRNSEERQRLFNEPTTAVIMPGGGTGSERPKAAKTLGQLFVESAEYKALRDGRRAPIAIDFDVDPRATLFDTAAGFAPESVRSGRLEFKPLRPVAVVDFIPQVPIDQSADVYMEETTATENSAERAESAAYAEDAYVWTERTQTVRSVGTSLPVSDEQLDDVPGMQAILEGRLPLSVMRRVDLQVLAGNGVAPNLLGTESVSGLNTQALGTDTAEDAIYKAIRAVRDTGFAEPEVIFIRAAKWEAIRLRKDANGAYVYGPPSSPDPERLWGLPVVQTNAVTATKAITGAYRAYSALRIRRGVTVEIGYVGSNFTEGKKTLRAGMRAAMVHYRPSAFAQVTGL